MSDRYIKKAGPRRRSSSSSSSSSPSSTSSGTTSSSSSSDSDSNERSLRRREDSKEPRPRTRSRSPPAKAPAMIPQELVAPPAPLTGPKEVIVAPPPPVISKPPVVIPPFKPPKLGIQMKLAAPKPKETPVPARIPVASVFGNDDDDDDEEMPPEARMRMRNIGRDTPTSSGPNSFGKTKQGFCDSKKIFERQLREMASD